MSRLGGKFLIFCKTRPLIYPNSEIEASWRKRKNAEIRFSLKPAHDAIKIQFLAQKYHASICELFRLNCSFSKQPLLCSCL